MISARGVQFAAAWNIRTGDEGADSVIDSRVIPIVEEFRDPPHNASHS